MVKGVDKMAYLKCNVNSCYYNEENRCSLDTIKVEGSRACDAGQTACGSFRLRGEGSASNSCGCGKPKDMVTVKCDATRCCYNDAHMCCADEIGITGNNACTCSETKCASFENK